MSLFIRCPDCHACSRVWGLERGRVNCEYCGREYALRAARKAPVSLESASEFSARNGIDVPMAGSVLLGIVSLERALEIRDSKERTAEETITRALDAALRFTDDSVAGTSAAPEPSPAVEPASAAVRPNDAIEAPYDPGFERAVARGHLSVSAAIQRGDRETLIQRLGDRYELPRKWASMVADNELNLRAAIVAASAASAASAAPEPRQQPTGRAAFRPAGRTWLIGGLVVALVLAMGWGLTSRRAESDLAARAPIVDPEPPPQPRVQGITERLLAATEVRANEAGEPVEIIGPDPRSVLLAYCERGVPGGRMEPVGIVPSVPRSASARLGVYRNPDGPTTLFAISIRRDRRSSRWVVGDGNSPIASIEAPRDPTQRLAAGQDSGG